MPKKKKKTSFPLQRDKKGKVTPVEGVTGPFADTVKAKKKWEESKKDYNRKQRARDEKFRSGVKKFVKRILSGGKRKAVTQRLKNLETMYPKKFIRRK